MTAASTGDTCTNTQGSITFMYKSMPKGLSETMPHFGSAVWMCNKRYSYPTDLPLQRLRENAKCPVFRCKNEMPGATLPRDKKKDAQALDL